MSEKTVNCQRTLFRGSLWRTIVLLAVGAVWVGSALAQCPKPDIPTLTLQTDPDSGESTVMIAYSYPPQYGEQDRKLYVSVLERAIYNDLRHPTTSTGIYPYGVGAVCGPLTVNVSATATCGASDVGYPDHATINVPSASRKPTVQPTVAFHADGSVAIRIEYAFPMTPHDLRQITIYRVAKRNRSGTALAIYNDLGSTGNLTFNYTPGKDDILDVNASARCDAEDKIINLSADPSCAPPVSPTSAGSGAGAGNGPSCPVCVGTPVRVSNGNVRYTETDPLPNGTGIPFRRIYDSAFSDVNGVFGLGWSSPFDAWLVRENAPRFFPTVVSLTTESRSRYLFFEQPDHTYQQGYPRGDMLDAVLKYDAATGLYTLREASSAISQVYDVSLGKLVSLVDNTNARRLDFTYSNGQPTQVADSWGRWTWNVTTSGGAVQTIGVANHPELLWTYHHNGNSLSVVSLDGTGMNGNWRSYTYDATALSSNSALLTRVDDTLGNLIESHSYDVNGRGKSSIGGVGDITDIAYTPSTDGASLITTITSPDSRASTYTSQFIEGRARTTAITGGCSACGTRDALYTYDAEGRVASERNARGYITTYGYGTIAGVFTATISTANAPYGCDPETDSARCFGSTGNPEPTSASVATSLSYGDTHWPDRPTRIDITSAASSEHVKSEVRTYDVATGRVLTDTVTGYLSSFVQETHTTTTVLYDGTEGAAFTPGGARFQSSWLSYAQPTGLPKTVV